MPSKRRVKAGTSQAAVAKRRKAFAVAYTSNGRNLTEAALAAGFSPRTAHAQGARLLKDVRTQAIVDELTAKAEEKTGFDADRALKINACVARFDLRKLYREDGTPIPLHELDDDTAMALSHAGPNGPVPNDRMRALDMAFKNMGLYERDNAQRSENLVLKVELVK